MQAFRGRLSQFVRLRTGSCSDDVSEVHRMKRVIWIASVATFLLAGASVAGAQTSVSVGIHVGGPPPPPQVVYVGPPPPPAPEYVWVQGYWYPVAYKHK